jgi:hypothetical protein
VLFVIIHDTSLPHDLKCDTVRMITRELEHLYPVVMALRIPWPEYTQNLSTYLFDTVNHELAASRTCDEQW